MDETALQYEMAPKSTVEFVGVDAVPIMAGNATSRVTVALTVTSNGNKLPPFVIYKAASNGRISRELLQLSREMGEKIEFSVQTNAWMDSSLMQQWLRR